MIDLETVQLIAKGLNLTLTKFETTTDLLTNSTKISIDLAEGFKVEITIPKKKTDDSTVMGKLANMFPTDSSCFGESKRSHYSKRKDQQTKCESEVPDSQKSEPTSIGELFGTKKTDDSNLFDIMKIAASFGQGTERFRSELFGKKNEDLILEETLSQSFKKEEEKPKSDSLLSALLPLLSGPGGSVLSALGPLLSGEGSKNVSEILSSLRGDSKEEKGSSIIEKLDPALLSAILKVMQK